MENQDISWKQRFEHFSGAYDGLRQAFEKYQERPLTKLENQQVMQAFDVTQELSWQVMKDFYEYQGFNEIFGSKNAVRLAIDMKLIDNGEVWMEMIKSRNLMSYSSEEDVLIKTVEIIFTDYIQEFEKFKNTMLTQ